MHVEPVLVLVSGDARQGGARIDAPTLAFATSTKELSFTSCSGILLKVPTAPEDSNFHDLVLVPASALRPWLKSGAVWDISDEEALPPQLAPDVAICAVGSIGLLRDGAVLCTPFATLHVRDAARTATSLLHNLNLGYNFPPSSASWSLQWSVGSPDCTAAEIASWVLCWVAPPSTSASRAAENSTPIPPLSSPSPSPPSAEVSGGACRAMATAAATALAHRLANGSSTGGKGPPLRALHAFRAALLAGSSAAAGAACDGCDGPGCTTPYGGSFSTNPMHTTQTPAPAALCPGCCCCTNGGGCGGGLQPGRLVTVVGSPFGCLAPFHFLNTHVNGAIACTFPLPPPPPPPPPLSSALSSQHRTDVPVRNCSCGGGRSNVCCSGFSLGPALLALDAHLFPGMEGALVASQDRHPKRPGLQLPPPCHGAGCGGNHSGTDVANGSSYTSGGGGGGCEIGGSRQSVVHPVAAEAGTASIHVGVMAGLEASSGAAGGAAAAVAAPRLLALLCPPLCRRADSVQVPLALAWPHVVAAMRGLLDQLLQVRPAAEAAAAGCGQRSGPGTPGAGAGGGLGGQAGAQQLELQPVSHRAQPAGAARHCAPPPPTGASTVWSGGRGGGRGGCGAAGGGAGAQHPAPGREHPSPHLSSDPRAISRQQQDQSLGRDGPDAAAASPGASPASRRRYTSKCLATAVPLASRSECLPAWVLRSVVLLRCNGSWATGVLLAARSGLLITTAHLFLCPTGAAVAAAAAGTGGRKAGQSGQAPRGGGPGREADGNGTAVRASLAGSSGGGGGGWEAVVCWARMPCAEGGLLPCAGHNIRRGQGLPYRWVRAHVVYVWKNHLDLAVLRLERLEPSTDNGQGSAVLAAVTATARAKDEAEAGAAAVGVNKAWVRVKSGLATHAAAARPPILPYEPAVQACDTPPNGGGGPAGAQGAGSESHGLALRGSEDAGGGGLLGSPVGGRGAARGLVRQLEGLYGTGTPVWAVGHSLVGPSAEWPPLVSYGCVARVLRSRCGRPTMVLATATTHAGGSGGALLDSGGRLVGLVTSNARHAGGTTLPNMAFCIAAEELEPVLRWAVARDQSDRGEYEDQGAPGAGRGCARGPSITAEGSKPSAAAAGAEPLQDVSPPQPHIAELAALDIPDDDAARIWRLQMPELSPDPSALVAAAAAGQAAVPRVEPQRADRHAPLSRL